MEKGHAVYSTKTKILRSLVWLFMLILALLIIFPVCYIVFGSFKANAELLVGGTNIFPKKWIFTNYIDAWKQANFATYTLNSVFLSLGVMFISLANAPWPAMYFPAGNSMGRSCCTACLSCLCSSMWAPYPCVPFLNWQ